jgi:hypothetical protein
MRLAAILAAALGAAEPIPVDWQAAINRVSADSLRGHLGFLSSDLLEGRATPSRGQDIAAEYIAAQFRRAGVEGRFHESQWKIHRPNLEGFSLEIVFDGKAQRVDAGDVDIVSGRGLRYSAETAVVAEGRTSRDEVAGRVVFSGDRATPPPALGQGAALVLMYDPGARQSAYFSGPTPFRDQPRPGRAPAIIIHRGDFPADPKQVSVSLTLADPVLQEFPLRNVVGLLRGSDPELAKTHVVVSAHYDHIGILPPRVAGDRVFNGANDNASGTAAVVELAGALASLTTRPKRSILFLAVAGEEKGLLGTRAFVDSPTVPLESIVANINLEVLGRTDTLDGRHEGKLVVTGIDYSSVGAAITAAGADTGVEVYKHPRHEAFFGRSDNVVFARRGIPAHTLANGFEYAGYHGLDDEASRIDYDNMARVTRTVALAILRIADSADAPRWTDAPGAKPYRDAKP